MRPRDFLLLALICLVWALNNVVSKIVVGSWHVPPIYFAAIRFAVVVLALLPWLLPVPKDIRRVAIIGLLMGAINFSLLFIAFQTTSPSVISIVIQSGVPFTLLLSVIMLGERIAWRRGLGIGLTLAGILIVIWDPAHFELGWGVAFALASAFGSSLGSVMMKQVENVEPLRFQAWVGLVSLPPLAIGTALTETGQLGISLALGWPFLAAVLFAALFVSVFAHSSFYTLIRRYDANLIVPLTLMNPLFTFGLAAVFTGDRFDLRTAIGAALALGGVFFIASRSRQSRTAVPMMVERELS